MDTELKPVAEVEQVTEAVVQAVVQDENNAKAWFVANKIEVIAIACVSVAIGLVIGFVVARFHL